MVHIYIVFTGVFGTGQFVSTFYGGINYVVFISTIKQTRQVSSILLSFLLILCKIAMSKNIILLTFYYIIPGEPSCACRKCGAS